MAKRKSKSRDEQIDNAADALNIARSMLSDALARASDADSNLTRFRYSACIQAAAESMEKSAKALVVMLIQRLITDRHYVLREEAIDCLKALRDQLDDQPESKSYLVTGCAQTFIWAGVWSFAGSPAKYGFQEAELPATDLFSSAEAQMASTHAGRCYFTASRIVQILAKKQ